MFKEKLLLNFKFKEVPNSPDYSAFDDALAKKTHTKEAIRRFNNSKNKGTDSTSESAELDDTENKLTLGLQEDLVNISLTLKKQLDLSLNPTDKFIDTQTAELRLEEIRQQINPQRVQEIKQELKTRQINISSLIKELDSNGVIKINNTPITVVGESSNSSREELIGQFLKLTPAEQEKKLAEIKNDIKEATELYRQLASFVNPDNLDEEITQFSSNNNTERKKIIQSYKKVDSQFKELIATANLPASLVAEQTRNFKEQGLEGRKHFLKVLKENLQQPNLDKEFEQADKKRQKEFPDFKILSSSEKNAVLKQIRDSIKTDYLDKFRNHQYYKHVGIEDIKVMEGTFVGKFDIQMGEACLNWLDKTMEGFLELHIEEQKFPEKVLMHFNWKNLSYFEKKELIKKGGKLETYSNAQENIVLDTKYKDRLTQYLQSKPIGLINQEGFKSYMDWFTNLELKTKQLIVNQGQTKTELDYLEKTKNARIKQNESFTKLPENIKQEFYDQYIDSGFEERKELLQYIKKQIQQLNSEFEEKLDEAIDSKLLSPKSRKRYWKMFTQNFNLQQKEDYLNDCNLDRKERKQLLNEFETEVLVLLPTELQDSTAKKFYNLDLRKRQKLVKELKSKYKPQNKKEEDLLAARKKAKKAEQKQEEVGTVSKEAIVREHFLKRAKELEAQKDFDGALRFYKEALEVEEELPKSEKLKITKKIEQLETINEIEEETKTTHFDQIIKSEIDTIIASSETLRTEQGILSLLEEAYRLQVTNERYYENATDAQTRMHRSLDDQYSKKANLEFQNYTDNSHSFYVDQWGDIEIGQELKFDISAFDTISELPFWMDYFSDVQDLPKEARADARFTAVDGKTGKTVSSNKFKDEILEPMKENFILEKIAPELFRKLEVTENPELKKLILSRISKLSFSKKLPKTNRDNLAVN